MSKEFNELGQEIIESPYIVDVDYIDYSSRIKEMVNNGVIAKYQRGKQNGQFDDTKAELEEQLGAKLYSDVGDIAFNLTEIQENIDNSIVEQQKQEQIRQQENEQVNSQEQTKQQVKKEEAEK